MVIHLKTDQQLEELKLQLQKGGARALKVNTVHQSVADPGFPVGGRAPVGGGHVCPARPPRSANANKNVLFFAFFPNFVIQFFMAY